MTVRLKNPLIDEAGMSDPHVLFGVDFRLDAEGFEGDVFDAGDAFGDGEDLSGFGAMVGAMIFAAGILPGGIGFEEDVLQRNLTQGFFEFFGGRGSAELSAKGKEGTEFAPGFELMGAAAPGVEENAWWGAGADIVEEVFPDIADGVNRARSFEGTGETELALKDVALVLVGGVGELQVEPNFADAGPGEAEEKPFEA